MSSARDQPPLPRPLVFVLALAAVSAVERPPPGVSWHGDGDVWLAMVLKVVDLERSFLPDTVEPEDALIAASEHEAWLKEHGDRLAQLLVQAALTPMPNPDNKKEEPKIVYSPIARACAHATLNYLGLHAGILITRAEAELGLTLSAVLDENTDAAVDKARKKQRHGWGGRLGRGLATGAGVIAGGVLIGVTGGLAAPAIIGVLAPLGIGFGAAVSAGTAAIAVGTLFGVTAGGLTGARVAERWRGVEEFSFVEVGAGTQPTKDEVEDLNHARSAVLFDEDQADGEALDEKDRAADEDRKSNTGGKREAWRSRRKELEDSLRRLSLDAGTNSRRSSVSQSSSQSSTSTSEKGKETRPSLTATIVVPGLITVSRSETLTAWRAICSPRGGLAYEPRKGFQTPTPTDIPLGLKDGRDVYLLKYETATMLKTGRDLESWVTSKAMTVAQMQIIKHTVLSAYYLAVALPLSVYKMTTLTLDNSWMYANDKASKAGRLLGEVLSQRVQGDRPVVLIGSSVGSLTVLHALLYLASLPSSAGCIVESAYFISLPSAPTAEEWQRVRQVVSRRVVNAWCGNDFVLASVVRLHEVLSRVVTLNNGVRVAGLGPVSQPGVEDVDLSPVLDGHSQINARMGDILEVIRVDE